MTYDCALEGETPVSRQDRTSEAEQYHLFETAAGTCGVAWRGEALTRLQLPEQDREATEARLRSRPGAVAAGRLPSEIARTVTALQRYFAGRKIDFGDVPLDLSDVAPFHRKIYDATRKIGWGETATYGRLATDAGSPGAARAVGQAMAKNPLPIIIPCHRVLAGGQKIGGFSAFGGAMTKERLLAMEGVRLASAAPLLALMQHKSP
jgi:methylated-DNA-[protein]-cysteine S-methyltransferase